MQEVGGSIPPGSTSFDAATIDFLACVPIV
jgi:hypothetical protein